MIDTHGSSVYIINLVGLKNMCSGVSANRGWYNMNKFVSLKFKFDIHNMYQTRLNRSTEHNKTLALLLA